MNAQLSLLAPWMAVLGWTLLHFLWQGLAVGAVWALVRRRLRQARCNARYAAGLGALGALAACPPVTFLLLLQRPLPGVAAAAMDALAPAADAPFAAAAAPGFADAWLPWLVVLWGIGVLAIALRALYQWRALARIATRWSSRDQALESSLARLARRFGLLRTVRVLVSARIETPTLIGWLKPVILLPTAVALGFPRQQVELILAHELGHLRRYDHLVNLAQSLLEIVLYYHPVVHWISRDVRNEREICCDELVLRVTAEVPREYARTLAALEELRQPPVRLALAASGGVLLERVRRIVGLPAPDTAANRSNGSLWLLAAFGLVLAVSALRLQREETVLVDAYRATPAWSPVDLRVLPQIALGMQRLHLHPAAPAPATALAAVAAPVTRVEIPVAGKPASIADVAKISARAPPAPLAVAAREPASTAAVTALAPAIASVPAAPMLVPAPSLPVTTPAPAPRPRLLRMVAPEYPGSSGNQAVRVDVGYTVAPDGSVRDIVIADGAPATFARATERALRQWHFAATSPSERDPARRYRQSFEFGPRFATPKTEEAGCILATGSHICRPPADGTDAHNLTILDLDNAR